MLARIVNKKFLLPGLLIISQWAIAQGYEVVDTKVLSAYENRSYYVTQELTLKPGFEVLGGKDFFVKLTNYSNQSAIDQNYVRTETILIPGITQESQIAPLTVDQKTTEFQYVDGLGRSVQKVIAEGSPLKKDVITVVNYDDGFDRQSKEYLPITHSQSFKGKFLEDARGEQGNYYRNPPEAIHPDESPYTETKFDEAPNLRKYGPGEAWAEGNDNKFVRTRFTTNDENEVLYWYYDGVDYPQLYVTSQSAQWPINSLYYPANLLSVNEEVDEQNHIKRSYTNFLGQVILQRTGDGLEWHDTYYVYDVTGNLKFVLPPEASNKFDEYRVLSSKQAFIDLWAFQYEYDQFGRKTGSKVPGSGIKDPQSGNILPGSGWTYFIYDKWDRLALTQDANQRENSGQWTFTKYDIHNRPIITGFTNGDRTTLIDAAANNTVRYETRLNNSIGYTNVAFPTHNESNLLTITYYDDYTFKTYSGWGTGNYDFVPETGFYQASDVFLTVKGNTTGTKVKVLGENVWLNSVTYYDNKYHTIQTLAKNYLGGIDRATNQYDFTGKRLKTLQVHNNGATSISLLNEFVYDHSARVSKVYQQIDNTPKILAVSNKYNELGQLTEKNLHSTDEGENFLQSIDYRYNIRGWLTHINNSSLANDEGETNNDIDDLFGMEINYNEVVDINGNSTKLYNGNIAALRWKWDNLEDEPVEKSFKYDYDTWSRLEGSSFVNKNGTNWNGSVGGYNEAMTYDRNGNITTLNRIGKIGGINQTIDQLGYLYSGNRLTNVHDNSSFYNKNDDNPDYGFSEIIHNTSLTEYEYDANGNLEGDANKGVELITYNHLDMPERIELEGNRVIEYTYDALGNKLRKVASVGSAQVTTDYVGAIHYIDNQLAFLLSDEGRIVKRSSGYDYEYFLKDHQGNTRVVFGNLHDTDEFTATLEVERNGEETNDFKNISRATGYNHTIKNYETPSPVYAAALNGNVGPAKILSVKSGDKLHLETFARYTGSVSPTKLTAAALASAVTGAFQVFPTGETQIAHGAVNGGVLGSPATENSGAPKAYLYYFLFSANYSWYQFGFHPISTSAALNFEKLNLDFTVNLPVGVTDGFVYTYVVNETVGTPVHFDDFKIVHEKAAINLQVLQASDYYPFGLSIPDLSWENETLDIARTRNNYTFQGQELQNEFNLDWYFYKYRMHDPAIGRFGGVDPLADEYYYNSTYAFSENRLVDGIELEGAEVIIGSHNFPVYSAYVGMNQNNWDGGYLTGGWNMFTDWALNKRQQWVDYPQGGVDLMANNINYKNNRGEYNPSIPDDVKQIRKQINDLKATTKSASGLVGILSQATTAQSFLMGGTQGTFGFYSTSRSAALGNLEGISLRGTNLSQARWAQNDFRNFFSSSADNSSILNGMSLDDALVSLTSNKPNTLGVRDFPIDLVYRGGETYMLNTRSSVVLTRAGIPRSQWITFDRTGLSFYENQLSNQLSNLKNIPLRPSPVPLFKIH